MQDTDPNPGPDSDYEDTFVRDFILIWLLALCYLLILFVISMAIKAL